VPAPVPGHEGAPGAFRDRAIELPRIPEDATENIPVDLTKRGDYEPL
jgi:hypothetical protein